MKMGKEDMSIMWYYFFACFFLTQGIKTHKVETTLLSERVNIFSFLSKSITAQCAYTLNPFLMFYNFCLVQNESS